MNKHKALKETATASIVSAGQSENSRKRHHKEDDEMNKHKALKETATASIVSAGQSENSRKQHHQGGKRNEQAQGTEGDSHSLDCVRWPE